jgi:DNA recombination protein RmuC
VGSLERQVLPTARKLNRLDESKVIGTLQAIEESPRPIAAYELSAELEYELQLGVD